MSASNYAKDQPADKRNNVYPSPPAFPSKQAVAGVPTASSVLTFNDNSTVLDVMVVGGNAGNAGIIGKWGTASVTASNFDIQVNSGQTRTFVIPRNPNAVINPSSVAGENVANGLFSAISLKTATAQSASVFTIEY